MAQRRRHLRRDVVVFVGSLVAHVGVFVLLSSEFRFYPPPQETQEAVQVEIVPETIPPPIPPIPPPKPVPTPRPTPPPPQPAPQPTPQPQPKPAVPTPQPVAPKPAVTATAPLKVAPSPTPAPAPKPANVPSPLAPTTPAPQPGPPQTVPRSSLIQSQARVVSAPHLVLHKNQDQGAPLAPPVSIPGATFAQPGPPASAAAAAPGSGAPGGGGAGGLPGGALPRFGSGLRGGILGCANADALHLSAEERARCDEALGAGAAQSPQMSAIDASKRRELDRQAASEAAAEKYRDSSPTGAWDKVQAGQPHDGQAAGSP